MAWEYLVKETVGSLDLGLNSLGARGWRFVGYVGSKYVFERRKRIPAHWWAVGAVLLVSVMLGLAIHYFPT
jgi:uncharacterized metal-binding protein